MDMEMRFPDFVNLCSDDEVEAKMGEEVRFDFTPNPNQGRPSFIDSNCQPEFEDNAKRQGFGEYENPYGHLIRFPVMDLEGRPRLIDSNCQPEFEDHAMRQGFEENENPYGYPINSHVRDMGGLHVNGFAYLSALPSSTPICRQFWKAGDYEGGLPRPVPQNGQNHLRVHPKFLHSNATSHKWAFGAIAELLDNAIDEVHSGASFVAIDKITNMRDGNPALLIQDDGGGMDPETLRHCMSFGFSNKQSDSSIGQYGNGFKTSTMRLGADVIVFSRCADKRKITVSVGLLSYTFLRQTGSDDIIVPMVDYEIDPLTGSLNQLMRHDKKKFASNLSTLLRWSPFATEAELLKQFNDMGLHGTKVVVFNLWFNDDGDLELDFDSDAEDIMISGAPKIAKTKSTVKMSNQTHIATRFRYSLRVYSSILYMHLPVNFRIILRGRVVDPHYIVKDLRFVECIKYKPQVGGNTEPTVITTIGFLEGAPSINVHGFNVYHKNRLILPFWPVVSSTNGKCKGVAGVLEVNFLKPTHNKQDFERSNIFERLETRLKDMSVEYWTLHGHLVGFPAKKALPSPDLAHQIQLGTSNGIQPAIFPFQQLPHLGADNRIRRVTENSSSFTINVSGADFSAGLSQVPAGNAHLSAGRQVVTALSSPTCSEPRQFTNSSDSSQIGLPRKRRHENHSDVMESLETAEAPGEIAVGSRRSKKNQLEHKHKGYQVQRLKTMVRENTKLKTQCLEFEKAEKQLLIKVQKLRDELLEVQQYHDKLQAELKSLDEMNIKVERQ